MLVWDPIVEKYLAFGTLKTAASGEYFTTLLNPAEVISQTEMAMRTPRGLAVRHFAPFPAAD